MSIGKILICVRPWGFAPTPHKPLKRFNRNFDKSQREVFIQSKLSPKTKSRFPKKAAIKTY